MNRRHGAILLGYVVTLSLVLPGWTACSPKVVPPETPIAPVSLPVQRKVTDYVEFTGW